jgi:RNA polymerase sigma-70 factor (ECF subfamily)
VTRLQALLADHFEAVRRYARSIGRDPVHVDDLVQECFARALSYPHVWREVKDMRAYLLTILHNVYVDDIENRWRSIETVPIEEAEPLLGCAPGQVGRLLVRDLARSLQMLPESRRRIVVLFALEGMSYQDIARQLELPIGTVMSRLSRARESLRRWMEDGDLVDGRGTYMLRRDRNRTIGQRREYAPPSFRLRR